MPNAKLRALEAIQSHIQAQVAQLNTQPPAPLLICSMGTQTTCK
uniref:Uncharacterized protein n=1 Tax=Arundo donax TaxID=35708 RepID=A0A0A9GIX1_ARUDO